MAHTPGKDASKRKVHPDVLNACPPSDDGEPDQFDLEAFLRSQERAADRPSAPTQAA